MQDILVTARLLAPERSKQRRTSVYQKFDKDKQGKAIQAQGDSLGLAYLLVLVSARRLLREERLPQGDLWCTGKITCDNATPRLVGVDSLQFVHKCNAFIDSSDDWIFFVPTSQSRDPVCEDVLGQEKVRVLSLRALRWALSLRALRRVLSLRALRADRPSPREANLKMVVEVETNELSLLVNTLFKRSFGKRLLRALVCIVLCMLFISLIFVTKAVINGNVSVPSLLTDEKSKYLFSQDIGNPINSPLQLLAVNKRKVSDGNYRETVFYGNLVTGQVSRRERDMNVYLIVETWPEQQINSYYAQPNVHVSEDGRWVGCAWLGEERVGIDHSFHVFAILTKENLPFAVELKSLPLDTTRSKTVKVKRKQNGNFSECPLKMELKVFSFLRRFL